MVESRVTAARIADARRVDCPRLPPVALRSGAARDRILATELLAPTWAGDRLVHNDYFMPIGATTPARHTLWGFGGNFVVLLPNGVSAFRFADGAVHDLETMILAGEAIRPFCTAPPVDAPPKTVQTPPLSAAELRAELPGNTFGAGGLRVFIAPDGRQYSAIGTGIDVGCWRITADGLYCRTWNVSDGGRERCYHVYRDGAVFTFHVHDRWAVFRWTRSVSQHLPPPAAGARPWAAYAKEREAMRKELRKLTAEALGI